MQPAAAHAGVPVLSPSPSCNFLAWAQGSSVLEFFCLGLHACAATTCIDTVSLGPFAPAPSKARVVAHYHAVIEDHCISRNRAQ